MIRFRLAGIPVAIEPWFFLTAVLIGPRDPARLAIWVPVVLAGVLLHEFGHAAAARASGRRPAIRLHGFGGVTSWRDPGHLTRARRIAITAAGPAVGLAVGGAALLVARLQPDAGPVAAALLRDLVWVNLGWGLLNLLPVLPLDGGAIVAELAQGIWGAPGLRIARAVSLAVCGTLAVAALAAGWLWSALVAGLLAAANAQALLAARGER